MMRKKTVSASPEFHICFFFPLLGFAEPSSAGIVRVYPAVTARVHRPTPCIRSARIRGNSAG